MLSFFIVLVRRWQRSSSITKSFVLRLQNEVTQLPKLKHVLTSVDQPFFFLITNTLFQQTPFSPPRQNSYRLYAKAVPSCQTFSRWTAFPVKIAPSVPSRTDRRNQATEKRGDRSVHAGTSFASELPSSSARREVGGNVCRSPRSWHPTPPHSTQCPSPELRPIITL